MKYSSYQSGATMRFSVAASCSRHLYSWLHGFPDVGPVEGLIALGASIVESR